jgi:hypothetical protein
MSDDNLNYYVKLLDEQIELVNREKEIVLSGKPLESILRDLKKIQFEYKKISNSLITVYRMLQEISD